MIDPGDGPLFEARGISKVFPGVRALSGVDLSLREGEVLGLVGENGAGKSTFMKILAGILQPDDGSLWMEGRRVVVESPKRASELGIALIHQELNLAGNLTVAANVFLGREPHRFGFLDNRRIRRDARAALEEVGAAFSPDVLVDTLTVAEQQIVEIAKAVASNARVLIMDEPTSSLTEADAQRLFRLIRSLQERQVGVVYISHRLAEVETLASRVMVLRDGTKRGELAGDDITHDAMVSLMVGREISVRASLLPKSQGNVLLEAKGLLVRGPRRHSVSFEVRRGEIVGLAGLVGAGRTEVLEALFGVSPPVRGEILVEGRAVDLSTPRAAIRAGLALVPEDRKAQALFLQMGVRENLGVALLAQESRFGWVNTRSERDHVQRMVGRLRIVTPHVEQPIQFLSGGNQQKVVLARWLALKPRVLLLDEPTRGVDVLARQEIYTLIEELAAEGMAVLFVSSELEELLTLAHRVLVMREGRLTGSVARADLSEETVMRLATATAEQS